MFWTKLIVRFIIWTTTYTLICCSFRSFISFCIKFLLATCIIFSIWVTLNRSSTFFATFPTFANCCWYKFTNKHNCFIANIINYSNTLVIDNLYYFKWFSSLMATVIYFSTYINAIIFLSFRYTFVTLFTTLF